MTTDSQFEDRSCLQFNDFSDGKANHINESTGAIDMVKRDRFELLSAYLDGEVTAAERKQVEEWLKNDPSVQRLYGRLLRLRQGLRVMPVPQPERPIEETVQQVMARLRRRSRLAWALGGTAIAATIIGTLSSLLPAGEFTTPQLAHKQFIEKTQPKPEPVANAPLASPLMVAINKPIMAIPKAAQASPEKPVNHPKHPQPSNIENSYH